MVGPFGLHPNKTMQSRALGLARPLVATGHVVRMFMPPWHTPAEANRSWEIDGVQLRYVPLRGGVPGITRQLVREVLAWQPDVVYCFKPKAYSGLVAWWLWQFHRHRLPLVTDTDDWEGWGGWNERAPYSRIQKHFFAWQEQWGIRHCHLLTVASRALETIVWGMGVAPARVLYVPNGPGVTVDWQVGDKVYKSARQAQRIKLGLADRPILLLYSRLFEFDTARLVDILARVKTAVPHLAILSIGTGLYNDDTHRLRQYLVNANLLDNITDIGWAEPENLPSLLAAADVGIYLMEDSLLNRTKCPVKLADMLAAGIPVVAEAVGQVTEYVRSGYNGLLRASGDTEGIASDIIHLLQHHEERQYLATNAQTHIRTHFHWSSLAEQVGQRLAKLCQ
ncbi:MAG: glycosyltransferase [Chloroflexi bacterium]|nr:MAG: glycosyltransferase [Chloroflexota bacterium]